MNTWKIKIKKCDNVKGKLMEIRNILYEGSTEGLLVKTGIK